MNDLQNENELKFSQEGGFFDQSLTIRILICGIFTFALFLFLHFREDRIEILELNQVAPHYVISQVDFNFYDEEATAILKAEAVRDIGSIYQIKEKEVLQRRTEFENFLVYNQEWRKYVTSSTFEEVYNGIEAIEKALLQIKFTDGRTIQKIKKLDPATSLSNFINFSPPDISTKIKLPQEVWKKIVEKALPSSTYHSGTIEFILIYYQSEEWSLEEDFKMELDIRKRIQNLVKEKYTHVTAGSRIIDQGERVTARHIAMLQAMKQSVSEGRKLAHPLTIVGTFILSLLFSVISIFYFYYNFPKILYSNRKLALIVTIIILTLLIAEVTELILITAKTNVAELIRYPIFIPFAAILLCSLMNPSIATFAAGFLAVVMTMSLAFEPMGFMLINLSSALVAILSTRSLRRRKEIFSVCFKAFLTSIVVIIALQLTHDKLWTLSIFQDIVSSAIFMLITGIAVVGLLPLLESTFHVMTDVTLTEYIDPNNDLLRRLSIEAGGTYQHSIVVGNIAEAAAVAIGANGLFCRVATLYHDIGKMVTPQYFTENQHDGMNIHQLLTPQESAAVIIAHVSEGVLMARKAGLPEPFIDIIKEHHGTTLVYYFYHKQLEKCGGDKSKINEAEFRYSGPKPRSKESGIIMIADTIEAASRSLEKLEEKTLSSLAFKLVRDKMEDGQLDHCLLTLEELSIVISTIVKTLMAFSHTRVKYPTKELK